MYIPPDYVFQIVWPVLYTTLAISFVRHTAQWPLYLFNILLNYLWYRQFFGQRDPRGAFVILIILWFSILGLVRFSPILWPYLIWVTYAGFLNYSFTHGNT